jgi:hypothetical protein
MEGDRGWREPKAFRPCSFIQRVCEVKMSVLEGGFQIPYFTQGPVAPLFGFNGNDRYKKRS